MTAQSVIFHQSVKDFFQFRVKHIDPGQVDGNRHGNAVFFFPDSNLPGCFRPHILVNNFNLAVPFKQGNKITGRNQAQFRMLPAYQRFRAVQPGRVTLDVEFRLVIYLEFPPLHGLAQIVQQALGIGFPGAHFIVIYHQVPVSAPHHVTGHPGPVKAQGRIQSFLPGHNAHAQADIGILGQLVHLTLEPIQQDLVVFPLLAENFKTVPFHTTGDSLSPVESLADFPTQSPQHIVCEFATVQLIDGKELLNIQNHKIHFLPRMTTQAPAHIFVEKVFAVQPGQFITFCHGNQPLSLHGFLLRPRFTQQQGKEDNTGNRNNRDYRNQIVFDKFLYGNLLIFVGIGSKR